MCKTTPTAACESRQSYIPDNVKLVNKRAHRPKPGVFDFSFVKARSTQAASA